MWTRAHIDELIPHIKQIAESLPPPPAHLLWLNWHPPVRSTDMVFSKEDNIYIALYGSWRSILDTPKYENWATNWMQKMAHLSTGIQLADENLHKRTAQFLSEENLQKLERVRQERDPHRLFNAWHSHPTVLG